MELRKLQVDGEAASGIVLLYFRNCVTVLYVMQMRTSLHPPRSLECAGAGFLAKAFALEDQPGSGELAS